MRILVAGWHGQVALALSAAAARRADVKAYAVGRPALDLCDRPSVGRALFGLSPDVIINTAAYTDVEGAESEPGMARRRNVDGAAALARQAARVGVPVIHLSTVYVFDGTKAGPYVEDDQTAPVNAYGRSKRDGEAAVAAANARHVILRTGWIYGPDGANFVTNILRRAAAGEALEIADDQCGSPTFAPALADAILEIAAKVAGCAPDDPAWGTYHIADAGVTDWHGFARAALEMSGRVGDAHPLTAVSSDRLTVRAPRPANAMLACERLAKTFGVRLPEWRVSLAECVRVIERGGIGWSA
jgi:dTDP-4-dehydrorhamnose reductase